MDNVDPFAGLKKAKEDYKVYDSHYEKIGKIDDLLVDDRDEVLYVGVKMGLFGKNSTIIPTEIVRVNDKRQLIEISEPADTIKHAPHFGHGDELTPELENHVRSYYGLEALRPSPEHSGGAYDTPVDESRFAPDPRVDAVPGERAAAQEDYAPESPAPRRPMDIPIDEDVPEFVPERPSAEPGEGPTIRRAPPPRGGGGGPPGGAGAGGGRAAAGRGKVHRLKR